MCLLFLSLTLSSTSGLSFLFLSTNAPQRDFLSANLRPVTAFLRHFKAGKSPAGSSRLLQSWNLTLEKKRRWFCVQEGPGDPGSQWEQGGGPDAPLF